MALVVNRQMKRIPRDIKIMTADGGLEVIHPSKATPDTQSTATSSANQKTSLVGHVIEASGSESARSENSSMTNESMYTSPDEGKSQQLDDDEVSAATEELLAIANIRLQQQQMQDQIKRLQDILREKDGQILQLTGQLRRATASKCDLVNACADLERQKEIAEKHGSKEAHAVKKNYLREMETRADMEREYMNEMAAMAEHMCDMDRRHKNALLERDFEIAKLSEELRRVSLKQGFSEHSK